MSNSFAYIRIKSMAILSGSYQVILGNELQDMMIPSLASTEYKVLSVFVLSNMRLITACPADYIALISFHYLFV